MYKNATDVGFLYGDIMREVSIAIIVASVVIGLFGRYTVSSGSPGLAFVVDGLTGQAWICSTATCDKLD